MSADPNTAYWKAKAEQKARESNANLKLATEARKEAAESRALAEKRGEALDHLQEALTEVERQLKMARAAYETEKRSAHEQHNIILAALDILSEPCPLDEIPDDFRRRQIARAKVTLEAA